MSVLYLSYLVGLLSFCTFAAVGMSLFSKRWDSYEDQYVKGAERSVEAIYLSLPPQHLFFLQLVSAFVFASLVSAATGRLIPSVCFGALAFFLPHGLLAWAKKRRAAAFGLQLTGFINILSNSLKAGYALPVALEVVRGEMKNPMRQEMNIVTQELRLGVPLEKALRNLHKRMPGEDLDLIVTAIVVAERVGGQLTNVLSGLETTIRERYKMNGRVQALTAQGKMEGLIVGFLPLFLGGAITLIDPKMMMPMFTQPTGWLMIAAIVILDLIGLIVIREIVTIEF